MWSRLKSTRVTCHCQVKSSQVKCDQVDRVDGGRLGVVFSSQFRSCFCTAATRRFNSRRDFKIQDMFALLRPALLCTKSTSLPKYRTKTWYAQHGAAAQIKRATSFLNKRSGTLFYHGWKPMQGRMSDVRLNIDILHNNFQENHTNSRRFPGLPGVVDPAGGE